MQESIIQWHGATNTRVPFGIYTDTANADQEQQRIYRGEVWNYLCLESEIPGAGDFRTTFAGETPIVVVRDADQEIYAFENRCAHRGALIALEKSGRADSFQCVYHAWSYNRQGDLTGVAFEKGVKGQGGMPASFCKEEHGPRKLRVAVFCGLVFGSFSEDVPSIEDYLGPEICERIERVLHKPVEVIGRFTQALPNNWKLYVENVRDSYHASLLHLFFTTFEINRLSQKGGIVVDESGGNHVSYSMIDAQAEKDASYRDQGLRSDDANYRLKDPSLLGFYRDRATVGRPFFLARKVQFVLTPIDKNKSILIAKLNKVRLISPSENPVLVKGYVQIGWTVHSITHSNLG